MAKELELNPILKPTKDSETVIEILSGPRWNGSYPRWEWSYIAFWWDTSPAFCGKCGRCTNPNNVEPCGHDEAQRKLRGQVFVSSLEEHAKRAADGGRTVRYVRDGKTLDSHERRSLKRESLKK